MRSVRKEVDIVKISEKSQTVALVGLGYVGLPLATAFARAGFSVRGFDLNAGKVEKLSAGDDPTGSVEPSALAQPGLSFTANEEDIRGFDFYIVAVPTPIDAAHKPDLTALRLASELVGRVIRPGAVVCYESTVYPGVTEDFCSPIVERVSGLARGHDFFVGYSPERINPGDREHTLESIVKVVSGENENTLDALAELYGAVVTAGVHRAPSIRVAEAAKVIENTQRDLNIALMNELAVIFDRLGIPTRDVLAAASTKWNFLRFSPGLVGGHCIGVDPYYLTHKAEETGYIPQVILAGRRINDSMGKFVAEKTVKLLARAGVAPRDARVGILGATFKENVPDLRNSRVPDIVAELAEYGVTPLVHDPLVTSDECRREYGFELDSAETFEELDALIIAVPHEEYLQARWNSLVQRLKCRGGAKIVIDVKGAFYSHRFDERVTYWSL